MLPFDKHICEYRIHCPTCRDLEGGREWRRRVAVSFSTPEPSPDWPCPAGYPWGHGGATPSTPRTTLAGLVRAQAARRSGCPSCRAAHAARLAAQKAAAALAAPLPAPCNGLAAALQSAAAVHPVLPVHPSPERRPPCQ